MRRPPRPPAIYAIADAATLAPRRLAPAAVEMAEAGIRWIQLRAKELPDDELYAQADECCRALAGSGVELWIDDRADLARLLPVAGVHLGQRDLPPAAARRVVGPDVWIGRSTHDREQFRAAAEDPEVDLVALGPIFATASKADPDPVVGLGLLRELGATTHRPVVAIGGIGATTLTSVLAAGADSAAMISAVCLGAVGESCRRLLESVREEARV